MPADDSVRVPDRHRRELERFAADFNRLGLADVDLAHFLLDLAVAAYLRGDDARADEDRDPVAARAPCEPAGRDPRAVPGKFRHRAVGVPDHDLGSVVVGRDHFEDPVGADAEVVVADPLDALRRQRNGQLRPLHEQVVVPETVPFRESHPRARPEGAGHPG